MSQFFILEHALDFAGLLDGSDEVLEELRATLFRRSRKDSKDPGKFELAVCDLGPNCDVHASWLINCDGSFPGDIEVYPGLATVFFHPFGQKLRRNLSLMES